MLKLPLEICVQLQCRTRDAALHDVMVSMTTFVNGQPYYDATVGMTDAQGHTCIRKEQFDALFQDDQRLFPMDYKVALESCDPLLEFAVWGAEEFRQQRMAAAASALAASEVTDWLSRARNSLFRTARTKVGIAELSALSEVRLSVEPLARQAR